MSLAGKPLWLEGMFMRPQHLQQQNRYLETMVERRVAGLGTAPWGLRACTIDRDLLRIGQVGLTACDAVFPDGTILSVPADIEAPPARSIQTDVRNKLIKLAVPARRGDALEVHDNDQPTRITRYTAIDFDVVDSTSAARRAVSVKLGLLRARLLIEGEPEDDLVTIPLARIDQVDSAGVVTLAPAFIPPVLDCAATPRLGEMIREVEGMLKSLGDTVAARVDPSRVVNQMAGIIDYLLLTTINRFEPLFASFVRLPGLHPVHLHQAMLELAGQLATYGTRQRRPESFPPYRHDALEATFAPVLAAIRNGLAIVVDERVVSIPLQPQQYGIWLGPVTDRTLLRSSRFVLAAKSSMPPEALRSRFPMQVKLGPVDVIRDLVNLQLPGIAIEPLPVAPREVPYYGGFVYFELVQKSDMWTRMQSSAAFALHVGSEFTDLNMELWAIRGAQG